MNIIKGIKLKYHIILPIVLMLLNLLIKGIYLSSNSIGGDEPFSIYIAQMNVLDIIKLLSQGNNPPLYEIILHFWIKIFGISAFSVRVPSLIFSTITVLYLYKFNNRYINNRVAILASIIFIFSNYHILFAHEARTYSLIGMFSVMSMYYFLNFLIKDGKEFQNKTSTKSLFDVNIILLILINTLLIYSHYFGFFILLTQLLFIVLNRVLLKEYWRTMLIVFVGITILYSPNIIIVFNRFLDSSEGTWVKPPNGVVSIYNMIWTASNAPVVTVLSITILISALIKFIIKGPRTLKPANKLVILWFVFIFFFMFFISYILPMFMDRYLMPAIVIYSTLLAISADYLVQKSYYQYVIPIIIILLFIFTVKPNISNKRNVKETVMKVQNLKQDDAIVYFCPSWFDMNFIYYYDTECFKNYNCQDIKKNIYEYMDSENIFAIDNWNQIDTIKIKKFNKVIYIDAGADFSFPNNGIINKLNEISIYKNRYDFYEIFKVYEYQLK